jgi:hypothetical protein
LVAREEIIGRVWGKDVYLDTDNSINSAIRKIRQVLKDDSENPVYVQTVTGKGYRFIAPLTEVSLPASHPDVAGERQGLALPSESDLAVPAAAPRSFWKRRWMVSLAVLGAFLAIGIYAFRMRARAPSVAPPHRVMLAVLPFVNLSNDPAQEYFSDGLTEETITDLGELNPEQLGLIARTSSTAYKGTNKTIAQIGHELGVDYVLEGSVRPTCGC